MDQAESGIRHLHLHGIMQCVDDDEAGAHLLDLQTERGVVRLHCDDGTLHALAKALEKYERRQRTRAENDALSVPFILRFLNDAQKGKAA